MNAQSQIERLRDRGYVVVPGFVPALQVQKLNAAARAQSAARLDPLEFEADLQYPGAPRSHTEAGGETVPALESAEAEAAPEPAAAEAAPEPAAAEPAPAPEDAVPEPVESAGEAEAGPEAAATPEEAPE